MHMITGSQVLVVEAAKWVPRPEGQHNPLPWEWRLWRLCEEGVEDEFHVMLECAVPVLVQLSSVMLSNVWRLFPGLKGRAQAPLQWWKLVMECNNVDVMTVVRGVPMYIPNWYV